MKNVILGDKRGCAALIFSIFTRSIAFLQQTFQRTPLFEIVNLKVPSLVTTMVQC